MHDVVHVAPQQRVRVQRVLNGRMRVEVLIVEQILDAEGALDVPHAGGRQQHGPASGFLREVMSGRQFSDRAIRVHGQQRLIGHSAGNHERDAGFVDEDRIRFVDDGGHPREWTMHALAIVQGETVTKVVEPGFIGRRVRDVGSIRRAPRLDREALLDRGHRQAEALVDATHPLGVPVREVVVGRQHVHAVVFARVPDHGRHSRKRLPFSRLHFDDVPGRERKRGLQLLVVHLEAEYTGRDDGRGGNHGRDRRGATHGLAEILVGRTRVRHAQCIDVLKLGRGCRAARKQRAQ